MDLGRTLEASHETDKPTHAWLPFIAVALLAIGLRPAVNPEPVATRSIPDCRRFFEPSVQMVRAPDGSKNAYG
jgi:hypothetical protein